VNDVADLRAVCLVVDMRSFTAAARAMGESKGTVSRRITRVERSLGTSLLRRSPRLVEPTEDGVAYRMHVGRVLELLGDANVAARRARATPSGHLRVTAPTDLAISILATPIAEFATAYPDVRVEMVISDKVLDFDSHHLDVALRASNRLPDTQLIARKLFDIELYAVASPAYLKARRAPRRIEELAEHRVAFLGSTRGRQRLAMRSVAAPRDVEYVEVRPAVSASDFLFVKQVAIAGSCIGVVPAVLASDDLASGRLVRVLKTHVMAGSALHLVHRGGRFLPPKVRAFVDWMLHAFGVRTVGDGAARAKFPADLPGGAGATAGRREPRGRS